MRRTDIEMDIPKELFDQIHQCINNLIMLDPERDSPAGQLLRGIAKAVSLYEINYFAFGCGAGE